MNLGEEFFTIPLRREQDVVVARQRARQIAGLFLFDTPAQIRMATVVSELARHLLQHTSQGKVEFGIDKQEALTLRIRLSSKTDGLRAEYRAFSTSQRAKLEVFTSLPRLVDEFHIDDDAACTSIVLGQRLPLPAAHLSELNSLRTQLEHEQGAISEHLHFNALSTHNEELSQALATLTARETELARVNRELEATSSSLLDLYRQLDEKAVSLESANRELEETNRGIIALYAELDEKASSLQKASEMKTSFLSHVSHEIRTPLNAILSLSCLLLDRDNQQWQPEQDRQIGVIHSAATELTQMVDDLLDTAKVEAGKAEMRYERFSITDLFASLRAMFKPIVAKSSAADLVIEDYPDLPELYTDKGKIAQILRNFLANAVKFTPLGEIRLSAEICSDLGDSAGAGIVFAVADTGIGIPEADQLRLFQEFTQVDGPHQKRVKGTGLGLALARKLATLLGGRVAVSSQVGHGSRFTLALPLAVATSGTAPADSLYPPLAAVNSLATLVLPPESANLSFGRPMTALIIDDQEAARYLLADLLTEDQIEVMEASSGQAGLKLAASEQPSVIFLDLIMPGMDGLEVLRLIKVNPDTSAIPVIIHSSKALTDLSPDDAGVVRALATGILRKEGNSRLVALNAVRQALGAAGFQED